MSKRVVTTEHAPRAIGPYSQAVRCNDLLFVSGQIPIDPNTSQLVDGTIEDRTRQVMQNIGAILGAAGATFADVVKATIYVTDLRDFAAINSIYGAYFSGDPPARATVQVAALPLGSPIEIDIVAHVSETKSS
jgi:2-iminobutanoate/2-iminopropanoate deaminase